MASAEVVDPEAFRQLYPHDYLQRFLAQGIRSDGRPLGRSRALSVTTQAVCNAEGSCLVKLGATSMLAGVKALVETPARDAPAQGSLRVSLELPPLCNPDLRPGKPGEVAQDVSHRLGELLRSSGVVDLCSLALQPGRAAWCLHVDVYCLNDDGALLDAALLACLGALGTTVLPALWLTPQGRLTALSPQGGAGSEAASSEAPPASLLCPARPLALRSLPCALTVGLYRGHTLVDPSREEQALAQALVTCAVDAQGKLLALHKPGGEACASLKALLHCAAAAKLRHEDARRALLAAGVRLEDEEAAACGV